MNYLSKLLTDKLTKKLRKHAENSLPTEEGKVHLSKFLLYFGIFAFLIFAVPGAILMFSDISFETAIILFALSLLGLSIIIGYVNCRISYDEEGFDAKNFLGIKRRYSYRDVTGIRENTHESFVFMGKHRVMVDEFSVGGKDFIVQVKKKYSALNGRRMVPRIPPKLDIFNGHVPDAGGALFAFILMAVMLLGFVIFTVVVAYFSPGTVNNTIRHTVCFKSHYITEDEIGLVTTEGQIYAIRFYDEQFDPTKVYAICDGKTVVTTYSTEIDPDDGKDSYYSVKSIQLNGTQLLSFAETDRFNTQEYWPLLLLSSGMLVLWCIYVTASVIVGRNPKKFSKKTVRFFFKNMNIRY